MKNYNPFHSIKTKLVLLIALVITSISVFVYFYFPTSFKSEQIKLIESRVKSLANIASYSVATAVYFADKDATEDQISSLINNENIDYLVIEKPNDSLFFVFNQNTAGQNNYHNFKHVSFASTDSIYTIKKNIEINAAVIGTLYLGYSLKELHASISNLKTHIAWVTLIILIVGLLAAINIGLYLTKPVINMVSTVEKIRAGNISKRADVITNDEIGYLAKSFNAMVDRIEDSNIELETINKNLELRVEERTKELNISKEKAEAAVRMKTEFLAQMSHEIRTPINSIMSYAQLLKDEVIDLIPEELRLSFDMINNGGRRLIRTVDLILNMSELQTGTYEVILEDFNINEVLNSLVGEFKTSADTKKIDLFFLNRLYKENSYIYADQYTITQIFANLIHNAIKYTYKGSIEVVSYLDEERHVAVDVQDTGIGISKQFQETLFEAFTQEEQGYTRKFEGNGLGMALVKEYCKLNNIIISVKSQKNVGSTFTVTFPHSTKIRKFSNKKIKISSNRTT